MKVPFRLPNLPGVILLILRSHDPRASFFDQEQARRVALKALMAEYFPRGVKVAA